ncbi:hypothetical protein [Natronorubrum sp. A-ect3]|uniref:DUF7847 domain-containing protein n=1 Tax=Natronorubrum sp. A-ect3 TaxID=3242698 RepID=UPI00359E8052
MSVLGSLSTAIGRLKRNPILFVGAFMLTSLSGLMVLPSFIDPVLGNVIWLPWMAIWPFLIAGFLGMVVETRTGSTTLSTFLKRGKTHYVSMLGATVLFGIVIIGIMIVSFIISFALMIGLFGAVALGSVIEEAALVLLIALGLLFLLVFFVPYLLVYMVFQFYDVGVVNGEQAVSSLQHSYDLVRNNLLSVVGYTFVFFIISVVGYGPGYGILFIGGLEITEAGQYVIASETMFISGGILTLILGTITMALAFTYHVSFYESILPESDLHKK